MIEILIFILILACACSLPLPGDEPPFPSRPCVHFPERDLEGVIRAPLQCLLAINQSLKYALGRSGNFDFADHRVAIGSDCGAGHVCSSMDHLFAASARAASGPRPFPLT